jgi:hypothetical protein
MNKNSVSAYVKPPYPKTGRIVSLYPKTGQIVASGTPQPVFGTGTTPLVLL